MLDTDVVVAATRSPAGASAAILRMVRQGDCTALMSGALALEYEAVCGRPQHRLAAGLTVAEAGLFINAVIAMAEPTSIRFLWHPQLSDSCDEMVLEAVINGQTDAIVTFNLKHFGTAPSRFGIETLLPREALKRMSL